MAQRASICGPGNATLLLACGGRGRERWAQQRRQCWQRRWAGAAAAAPTGLPHAGSVQALTQTLRGPMQRRGRREKAEKLRYVLCPRSSGCRLRAHGRNGTISGRCRAPDLSREAAVHGRVLVQSAHGKTSLKLPQAVCPPPRTVTIAWQLHDQSLAPPVANLQCSKSAVSPTKPLDGRTISSSSCAAAEAAPAAPGQGPPRRAALCVGAAAAGLPDSPRVWCPAQGDYQTPAVPARPDPVPLRRAAARSAGAAARGSRGGGRGGNSGRWAAPAAAAHTQGRPPPAQGVLVSSLVCECSS